MYGDELSGRKKMILKAIVESHIECGDPVGSKSLLQMPGISCSSATVRNEMAELEEMGYLEQPHTSAGRVPSQLGYRFYVDQLIEHYKMTNSEINQINRILKSKTAELDQILLTASKLASAMTNYTGLAVQPKRGSVTVTRFSYSYLDSTNFVLIMVTSLGVISSKHIRLSEPKEEKTVAILVKALNDYVSGLAADAINLPVMMKLESVMGEDAAVISPIVKTVYSVLSEYDGGEIRTTGINHLLEYPDYDDPDELSGLLDALEQKDDILKLVDENRGEDVSVVIGSESSVKVMNNSSLVFKQVKRNGKVLGVIGVLGPRRMDYAKVLETIEQLCGSISEVMDEYQLPAPEDRENE
ncbi:MAG: heat-inducible transcriptional repressor HrcA [Clostridia bacterium]|nr:heat-inducible transcriptional repressor HrcA [Clostridia bacterium]